MPAALPIELRERIVRAHVERGMPQIEIAEVFQVAVRTVSRYVAKYEQNASLEPGYAPGATPKLTPDHEAWLRAELEADPFTSSYDLAARFNRRFRASAVHRSTILRAMHRLGFTHKKRRR